MYHIVEFYDGVYYDTGEEYADEKTAEANAHRITEEMEAFSRFDFATVLDDKDYVYFLENGQLP